MSLLSRYEYCLKELQYLMQTYGRGLHAWNLLVVSKQQSIEDINILYQAGQRAFGENYVQEALPKMKALKNVAIEWHFIGKIQSNKTRLIAENFSWVHGVDRKEIAERLNAQRPASLPPLSVCLAVNIHQDTAKSGVDLTHLPALIERVRLLPRLQWRGLMCMITADYPAVGEYFQQLQQQYGIDTLSMGMSQDKEIAIAHGANLLRIGTAIFGERQR